MKNFIGSKIALFHNGKLPLIQRDDKSDIPFPGFWDFPGGGREGNETPEECVIRETYEELRIVLKPEQLLYKNAHPASLDPSTIGYFFVANISDSDIERIVFGDEGQGWWMFDIDEFFASNKIIDPWKDRLRTYLDSINQE